MRIRPIMFMLFILPGYLFGQEVKNIETSKIADTILVKSYELTGMFNCMQYEKYYELKLDKNGLEQVEISTLKPAVKIYYSGRAYVKEDCVDTVKYQDKPANGLFKIYDLNSKRYSGGMASADYYFGLNHIDYVVANFINGKKEGIWYYYPAEPLRIWEGITLTQIYRPIKCEIYKNGKPDGLWWQLFNGNKMVFFEYKNGKFLN
ncbi:hypothetical protein EZJ43_13370 [Pedobacter changchengzhani]|uniref:WG repeat-containing protein n=1 Tax=Pedobacter changchengzhani TaxID=2529274 RepID=A0A4R5MJ22_9SPHI|nr:hypothetical protein [Pedobacter changchengzhani]TDG35604.1 hypothetical protein EZJ43_13370 [Pedobacter changchengzhani]